MSLKCHFSGQEVGVEIPTASKTIMDVTLSIHVLTSIEHNSERSLIATATLHLNLSENIRNQQQIWFLLNIEFPKQVCVCNRSGLRLKQLWIWWEGGERASLLLDFVSICNNFNNAPIKTKGNSRLENPHILVQWRALAVSFLGRGGFEVYVNLSQDKMMLWRPSLWNTICHSFKQEPGILGCPLAS